MYVPLQTEIKVANAYEALRTLSSIEEVLNNC